MFEKKCATSFKTLFWIVKVLLRKRVHLCSLFKMYLVFTQWIPFLAVGGQNIGAFGSAVGGFVELWLFPVLEKAMTVVPNWLWRCVAESSIQSFRSVCHVWSRWHQSVQHAHYQIHNGINGVWRLFGVHKSVGDERSQVRQARSKAVDEEVYVALHRLPLHEKALLALGVQSLLHLEVSQTTEATQQQKFSRVRLKKRSKVLITRNVCEKRYNVTQTDLDVQKTAPPAFVHC